MDTNDTLILPFDNAVHRQAVIDLWKMVFDPLASYNDPAFAIDRKRAVDDLFFVAVENDTVIGTIMAGYDGHRGWIYSLAVHPDQRKHGIGSMLLHHAENALTKRGCFKINLQVRESNVDVIRFYEANGFAMEKILSMGKVVDQD
ncbi:GNAT family acetyltransferase [Pseudodesulfovibrio sediminis]|nr:GNAT family acetyltransferase [Pseudodesulfovibrio sediminis]